MPIRQDDNQPNRRFGIVNIVLIGVGALLLFSSLFPNQNMQIPRVPYSLFIDQVNDGEVKRAYITQDISCVLCCETDCACAARPCAKRSEVASSTPKRR